MVNEINVTVVGNLGGSPELRFTPSGAAVCNVNVCQTPRRFDKQTNEWVDGDPVWVRLNMWRHLAEHAAETLAKGMRVIAHGQLRHRKWETTEGEARYSLEMDVDEIGPSLKYATAKVTKATNGRQSPPPPEEPARHGVTAATSSAARAAVAPGRNDDPWAGVPDDEPPPF